MRIILAIIAAVLLAQSAIAQPAPLEGESPREKARNALKRERIKADDKKYRELLDNIPEQKAPDPWANARTPGDQPQRGK